MISARRTREGDAQLIVSIWPHWQRGVEAVPPNLPCREFCGVVDFGEQSSLAPASLLGPRAVESIGRRLEALDQVGPACVVCPMPIALGNRTVGLFRRRFVLVFRVYRKRPAEQFGHPSEWSEFNGVEAKLTRVEDRQARSARVRSEVLLWGPTGHVVPSIRFPQIVC